MNKSVTGFTFLEFMQSVQDAVLEGYRLDFDNIDNVPQRFGNTYECIMMKVDSSVAEKQQAVDKNKDEEVVAEKQQAVDKNKDEEVVAEKQQQEVIRKGKKQ